jgi:hypothetical protein
LVRGIQFSYQRPGKISTDSLQNSKYQLE